MLLNKVVIAEDDDAIQHMLGAFLGDAGFLCLHARNGRDALRLTRTQQPDLLILDIMMPEMDGIEVARRLKADPLCSAIPILMLTSLSSIEDKVKGFEVGADEYLPKPFDVRELVARVRSMVRVRRRERERDPATGLPSGIAVEGHVDGRLHSGKPFALLHLGVDGFRDYATRFGFHGADAVLAAVGLMLSEVVNAASGAFLAHVGGGDFVIACEPAEAEAIARDSLAAFDALQPTLAPEGAEAAPRMTLQIAGVDTGRTPVASAEVLSRTLAEAGRKATGTLIRWAH